jgi:hypothetical protein
MTVKPLARLTRSLRGIILAAIVASLLALGVDLYAYAQYSELPAEGLYEDYFLASDGLNAVVGLAQLGLFIALAVIFLMWVHRANKNLRALSGESLKFTPGWCVGWFFIPVANLFKPYQAVKEIWTVSHGARPDDGSTGVAPPRDGAATPRRGHALVGWWWGSFLLTNALGQAAWRSSMSVTDVGDYRTSTLIYTVSDGADAIGQAVTLLLVGAIAAAYAVRVNEADAVGAATWSAGAAGGLAVPVAPVAVPAAVVPALGVVYAGDSTAATTPPAAWHADPLGRHEWRWWDGAQWTASVADAGAVSVDPL